MKKIFNHKHRVGKNHNEKLSLATHIISVDGKMRKLFSTSHSGKPKKKKYSATSAITKCLLCNMSSIHLTHK